MLMPANMPAVMKNARKISAGRKKVKIIAKLMPFSAAYAQNMACAVVGDMRWKPNMKISTGASGASIAIQPSPVGANVAGFMNTPNAASDVEMKNGQRAGQRQAQTHVVVNAQHVGPQSGIDAGLGLRAR